MPIEVLLEARSVPLHELPWRLAAIIARHASHEWRAMQQAHHCAFHGDIRRAKHWITQALRHRRIAARLLANAERRSA